MHPSVPWGLHLGADMLGSNLSSRGEGEMTVFTLCLLLPIEQFACLLVTKLFGPAFWLDESIY